MEHFKIIKLNEDTWTIAPTAEHMSKYLNKNEFPYDTNWEIYKLFNYTPEQLCQHITVGCDGYIEVYPEFPIIGIKFAMLSRVEAFKEDLEKRFAEQEKETK